MPLNKYLFLVRKLRKRPHLAVTQFHQAAGENRDKNIIAIIRKPVLRSPQDAGGSAKGIEFAYTHCELALLFRSNPPELDDKIDLSAAARRAKVEKRIKFINTYNTLLYKILWYLMQKQKAYFSSGNIFDLRPLTQKEACTEINRGAADRLRVNASWIHYIISAKNILTPKGEILPLRALFFSKKKWVQLRIEAILAEEKRSDPFKDRKIQREIFSKYGRNISLRGICSYRHSLHIPAWYKRKEGGGFSCPINFSAEYLLTKKNYQKYVPSKPGIYIFKRSSRCFYVGSSGNLRKRIRTHLYNGSKNKKLSKYIRLNKCAFQYAIINRDWKVVERQLYLDFIRTHAAPPLFNKMRP